MQQDTQERRRNVTVETYRIRGLDCAACAANVERTLSTSGRFGEASVSFATERLTVEQGSLDAVQAAVREIEPEAIVEPATRTRSTGPAQDTRPDDGTAESGAWLRTAARVAAIVYAAATMVTGLAFHDQLHATPAAWAEYALLLSAYAAVGWPVLWGTLRSVRRGRFFDENTLMTIATVGAIAIHEMPEAVAVMLFYSVGEYFQDRAVGRSRRSITALMDARPDLARIIGDEEASLVAPEDVAPGSRVEVRPGEKVPLDGVVEHGESAVNTAALTGESLPRTVGVDDEVLAGMINTTGVLTVRVTRPFEESSVSKILELVQDAASRKAPTEKFISRFARVYTPAVVALAALVAVVPPLLFPDQAFADWLYRALILLVISCPCGLVISIPLGYFGGIGAASRRGILVKGANYLDALTNVETAVFDKTGTITEGVFRVSHIAPVPGTSEEELLGYAAIGESRSSHPIARSIMEARETAPRTTDNGQTGDRKAGAGKGNEVEASIIEYHEVAGHGTIVKTPDHDVVVGNRRLLQRESIEMNGAAVSSDDGTVVHVAVDGVYIGSITVADRLKPGVKATLTRLRRLGVKRTLMLTGDTHGTAERIARESGVDEYRAQLLPEDKVGVVETLLADHRGDGGNRSPGRLLFVGDGINDAPVISRADIGVAMGALGSDAAVEAADVVVMDDRPEKVADAMWVARRTKRIVMENIVFAMGVKAVFVILGVLNLTSMWGAVFADVGVALLAVLNATRVLQGREPEDQRS